MLDDNIVHAGEKRVYKNKTKKWERRLLTRMLYKRLLTRMLHKMLPTILLDDRNFTL